MKKQFFRVKQLADQTFLRADKSEGLNHEELHIADQKVEYFRNALSAIGKRLPFSSPNQAENVDKRMKKYPEYQLGLVLQEQAKKKLIEEEGEDDSQLFQSIIKYCGQAQQDLAKEQAEHEIKVEQLVSAPVQAIIDNELPNILKYKRNLSKYILDKDSVSNRYHAASKNSNQKDALKDELEEADLKVEQTRDQLAAEMFALLRKENELSQYMLQILKLQRGYHESALKYLEKMIPDLERKIGDSSVKAVFGVPLEEHLRVTKRKIAYPLELCICILTGLGMSEEGLFRVAGGNSRVKRLKMSIDSGCFSPPLLAEYRDVHVIASTLKSYLRELPEPLLTNTLYNEWMSSMKYPEEQKVMVVKDILRKLPVANRDNLTYLIRFLSKLSKHPENKMSTSNIAICISPNLLWSTDDEVNVNMANCSIVNQIVELFLNNVDVLFPEDVNQRLRMSISDLLGEDEFVRPPLNNVKLINHMDVESEVLHGDSSSPKPQTRSKKRAPAPVPPASNKADDFNAVQSLTASYPSGSSTLNRSHKVRNETKVKTSVGVNTDEVVVRRRSLVLENTENTHKAEPKAALVNLDDGKVADVKYVSQSASNIQISKAVPIQQITAQITNNSEKPPIANNSQKTQSIPTPAPRTILIDNEKSTLRVENPLTKSLNSMEVEGEVQIRKPQDYSDKPAKPSIPARPASLRSLPRGALDDPTLHRTQCSVYSVAFKQQPSIVNIQNRAEKILTGHDTQIAEKEKFLGHQPDRSARSSTENKFNDINFNCDSVRTRTSSVGNKPDVPSKPTGMKSSEKLNVDSHEKFNGNSKPSHVRTRSDGNLVDLNSENLVSPSLHMPPSPRGLNKPTQPPPPPPTTTQRPQSQPESTNL